MLDGSVEFRVAVLDVSAGCQSRMVILEAGCRVPDEFGEGRQRGTEMSRVAAAGSLFKRK